MLVTYEETKEVRTGHVNVGVSSIEVVMMKQCEVSRRPRKEM